MSTGILKAFYHSDEWQRFRLFIIAQRGLKCQKCGRPIGSPADCIIHHIKELTPENVSDVAISLNPENVQVVCHTCHDHIHRRFCRRDHAVYVVYGPPMSGKSTFVQRNMQRGDLVVDIDRLYAAVTMLPEFDKPDSLFGNVIGLYNLLVDNIKTRYGKWNTAWVVGGLPDRYRREQLASDLGAELVFCDVTREECLARLDADEARRCRKDEWQRYIGDWFTRHTHD